MFNTRILVAMVLLSSLASGYVYSDPNSTYSPTECFGNAIHTFTDSLENPADMIACIEYLDSETCMCMRYKPDQSCAEPRCPNTLFRQAKNSFAERVNGELLNSDFRDTFHYNGITGGDVSRVRLEGAANAKVYSFELSSSATDLYQEVLEHISCDQLECEDHLASERYCSGTLYTYTKGDIETRGVASSGSECSCYGGSIKASQGLVRGNCLVVSGLSYPNFEEFQVQSHAQDCSNCFQSNREVEMYLEPYIEEYASLNKGYLCDIAVAAGCGGGETQECTVEVNWNPDVTDVDDDLQCSFNVISGDLDHISYDIYGIGMDAVRGTTSSLTGIPTAPTSEITQKDDVFLCSVTPTCKNSEGELFDGGRVEAEVTVYDVEAEAEFDLDPLIYEVKDMDEDLNPYNDDVVSTFDELLCEINIRDVAPSAMEKLKLEYEITGTNGFKDIGHWTEQGGFVTEEEDLIVDNEYVYSINRDLILLSAREQGNVRDDKKCKISESSGQPATIRCTLPVSNEYTVREGEPGNFEGKDMTCKVTVLKEEEEVLGYERELHVAELLNIFMFSEHLANQKREFIEDELTGFIAASGASAKRVYRVGPIRNTVTNARTEFSSSHIQSLFQNSREHWNPKYDKAVVVYEGGDERTFVISWEYIVLPYGESYTLLHEFGHAYGDFCEEYAYNRPGSSSWLVQNNLKPGGCPNVYPSCCNDEPSGSGGNLNCFPSDVCEVGMRNGVPINGPTYIPTSNGWNACAGNRLATSTWSIMGLLNVERIREDCMGGPSIVYPSDLDVLCVASGTEARCDDYFGGVTIR